MYKRALTDCPSPDFHYKIISSRTSPITLARTESTSSQTGSKISPLRTRSPALSDVVVRSVLFLKSQKKLLWFFQKNNYSFRVPITIRFCALEQVILINQAKISSSKMQKKHAKIECGNAALLETRLHLFCGNRSTIFSCRAVLILKPKHLSFVEASVNSQTNL